MQCETFDQQVSLFSPSKLWSSLVNSHWSFPPRVLLVSRKSVPSSGTHRGFKCPPQRRNADLRSAGKAKISEETSESRRRRAEKFGVVFFSIGAIWWHQSFLCFVVSRTSLCLWLLDVWRNFSGVTGRFRNNENNQKFGTKQNKSQIFLLFSGQTIFCVNTTTEEEEEVNSY